MAQGFKDSPIDAAIIGIVDHVDTPGVPSAPPPPAKK